MGYYANRLKEKIDNMSEEELEQKMQEMEDSCNIGPEASEFIKEQENYINYMKQKELELTAQEIVEKLIDEQKISGKEAVILLNAINKPTEIRIEKEYTPYIPNTTPWYQQNLNPVPKECYEPEGTCINPHMDCINCPKYHNYDSRSYTAATREIPTTMKEEPKKGL